MALYPKLTAVVGAWPAFACLQSLARLSSFPWKIIDVPIHFALFQSRATTQSVHRLSA
jgi:hypothetical protein